MTFHFHTTISARSGKRAQEPSSSGKKLWTSVKRLVPQNASSLFRSRFLFYGLALAVLLLVEFLKFARAGGPKYIAGISYFNAGLAGQPISWSGGTITYYTDQGDLSPLLRGTNADAFIADAFSRWTAIPTAAVSATRGGQLAENVSGANVILNADRSILMPADIQPSATPTTLALHRRSRAGAARATLFLHFFVH